jgi:HEAT repeat protein
MATPDHIQTLVQTLINDPDSDESPIERADILKELVEIGEPAIGPLIDALATPNSVYLVHALIEIGEPSVQPLIDALSVATTPNGDNALRRGNVAHALGRMKAIAAIPVLLKTLRDNHVEVRKQTASALAQFQDERIVLPLCESLNDTDSDVRSSAAHALGLQGDIRSIEALKIAFVQDNSDRVRRAAHEALRRLDADPGLGQVTIAPDIQLNVARMLAETPQSADHGLSELHDKRATADFAHITSANIPQIELLIATLESDEYSIQSRAARELVNIGVKAVDSLIAALQSSKPSVRARAAWALGEIGDKRAAKPLRVAKKDKHEDVQYASERALKKLK